MSSLGNILIQLGQTLPATLRKRKQDAEEKARQDEKDALSQQVTNAQLDEYKRKLATENAAAADEAASRKVVSDYTTKRGLADSLATLGQINLNGNAGDATAPEPTKLIPSQQADVAAQANAKYPSLGRLPGQAVLNKPALSIPDVKSAGYILGPGRMAPEASPIAGSASAASLDRGQSELDQGAAAAGKSRVGLLSDVGGLALAHSPTMEKAFTTTAAQDKADQDAAEKKAALQQAADLKREDMTNRAQMHDETMAFRRDAATTGAAKDETLPPSTTLAQKVIDGEFSFKTALQMFPARMGKGVNKREKLVNEILTLKPEWNESDAERNYAIFNSKKNSDQVNAIETFLPNIKRFEDVLKSIPDQTGSMTLNKLINTGQFEFGGQKITSARTLAELLAVELGRSVGSGKSPTDQDMKVYEKLLSPNKPLDASLAALETLRQTEVNRHINLMLQSGEYGEHYLKKFYGEDNGQRLIDEEKTHRQNLGVAPGSSGSGTAKTSSGNRFTWQ